MLSTRALVSAASLALVLASHGAAEACTGMFCPGSSNYLPWSGTVPASLPGILVYARFNSPPPVSDLNLALFRVEAGTQVPVDFTAQLANGSFLITPALPLVPDSDYAVEGKDVCASGISTATFHTGATAPLPTTLGALTAGRPYTDSLQVPGSSSCTTTISAVIADIDIALSAEALPWQEALSFRTFVDGKPWAYRATDFDIPSLGGRMHEALYASCSGDDYQVHGLEVGTHSVWMEATIPGSATVLKTEPISVTLSCTDGGGNASSGCQMGLGGRDGAWAMGVFAALAMMGRRRRRCSAL